MQNNVDKAVQHYVQSLAIENSIEVSYQVAHLLMTVAQDYNQAVEYLTNAIDQA